MYLPPVFREDKIEVMHDLIKRQSFATLITLDGGEICANHLPFIIHPELSEHGTLRGHISKGNPLWKSLSTSDTVLAIFQGADHYISPNWYPSKQDHHKEVPTWNYAVVHAHGTLTIIEDQGWLKSHLNELTNHHERNQQEPWKVSDAPEKYVDQQINGIAGIEIVISKLEGKWKAGQNKKEKDIIGAAEALSEIESSSAKSMSKIMAERIRTGKIK